MQVDKLLKHYRKSNWIHCATLILNPCHKLETFDESVWGRELKTKAYEKFEKILENEYAKVDEEQAEDREESSSTSDDEYTRRLKMLYGSNSSKKPAWEVELDNYLRMDRADVKTYILQWRKDHEKCYPHLAAMAQDLLSIPASSARVERLFSRVGLILNKLRNRSDDHNMLKLLVSMWIVIVYQDQTQRNFQKTKVNYIN